MAQGVSETALESLGPDLMSALVTVSRRSDLASPLTVAGKSGIRHAFTLGSEANGIVGVACDIVVSSTPLDETKVLTLFIKVYDVGAKSAVLCAIPGLTDGAKKLSGQYKIIVVEPASMDKIPEALGTVFQRLSPPA